MIPPAVKSAIDRHVRDGDETGGFVNACLENDLKEAFARADEDNTAAMREIVAYLYNEIPSAAWGSPAKVRAWKTIRQKRATLDHQKGP